MTPAPFQPLRCLPALVLAGLAIAAHAGSGDWREGDGGEWLASLSLDRAEGPMAPENGDLRGPGHGVSWDRWLSEARRGEWSAQLTAVERRHVHAVAYPGQRAAEARRVITLAHDTEPAAHLTASTRVTLGDHRGRLDIEQGDEWLGGHGGRWWSADSQWTYEGIAGHRLVAGVLFRHDFRPQGSHLSTEADHGFSARQELQRRSIGLSIEDEVALGPDCRGTFGLQLDRRDNTITHLNPHSTMGCDLAGGWTTHLSHGRATYFAPRAEEGLAAPPPELPEPPERPESLTSTAAVVEWRDDALRWAARAHHYRIDRALDGSPPESRLDGQGAEVELEWQHAGWHVHGSQAWQSLRDGGGTRPSHSPRTVTQLQISAPLDGQRARLSATVRSLGAYHRTLGEPTPRHTQVDLAGQWHPDGSQWAWGLGVRNLFNQRSVDFEHDALDPTPLADRPNRALWLSLIGTWP